MHVSCFMFYCSLPISLLLGQSLSIPLLSMVAVFFFFLADDAQMLTTTKDHNEPLRKKEFLCLLQLGSKVSK